MSERSSDGGGKRTKAWDTSQEEDSSFSTNGTPPTTAKSGGKTRRDTTSDMTDSLDPVDWAEPDEIVISGISGRLPRSDNIQEFGERILNAEDLVTEDNSRWEPGIFGLPPRHGKLNNLSKFDAQFFGVSPRQVNYMDPQMRILQEVAYEAMLDAGVNPKSLRGRKIGVFVGCSGSETSNCLGLDVDNIDGYILTGCQLSMLANRLSYAFDFQGPSFVVDTACSSSLLAIQLARDAFRNDECEAALVCASHLTLLPNTSLEFSRLGVLSPTGNCRTFDNKAEGYVRGEGIVAIFLQKAMAARRQYATIVHVKSNTDGFKEEGITFPGGRRQQQLLQETYEEAGVDPQDVVYVEAHGTGTFVGDPQEANALTGALCHNRTADNPLLIGSVKTNMGHAEPASGLASVAKMIIAMETGYIPPSRNYEEPNQYIPALLDGRLKVVTEKTAWNGGLVGINAFGFGGSNTHVILRSFPRLPTIQPPPTIAADTGLPLMLCYAGRTQDCLEKVFETFERHRTDPYFYKLLSEHADLPTRQNLYRGYVIVNAESGTTSEDENAPSTIIRSIQKLKPTDEPRPVWWVYSGMGTQWPGMGKDLMQLPLFKDTIVQCTNALRDFAVDPYALIMADAEENVFQNSMHSVVCITAIQIALTEILRKVGLSADGIVGHSSGEMACGYADGGLTLEQTMLLAYYRGSTVLSGGLSGDGGMAAVGMTWEEAQKACADYGVYAACHNGANSVTISGNVDKVEKLVADLKEKEVFAKSVNSAGVPFHTPMMGKIKNTLIAHFRNTIPNPKLRTSKWLSTSNLECDWGSDMAQYCSAEYHVNNVMSSVLFHEALLKIPDDAVTIEVAPHCVMQAILRRNLSAECSKIGLMNQKQEEQLSSFLQALGKIHQTGTNLHIDQLYPTVIRYPVPPATPMIAPLLRWDHAMDWPVADSANYVLGGGAGKAGSAASVRFTFDPFGADSKDTVLLEHELNGKSVFPLTGHIVMAWKAACQTRGLDYEKTPFTITDLTAHRATFLQGPVEFVVILLPGNGQFNIMEGDQLTLSGTITLLDEEDNQRPFFYQNKFNEEPCQKCDQKIQLSTDEIYQEFATRGYGYSKSFRALHNACGDRVCKADCIWEDSWMGFMDLLLQVALLSQEKDYSMIMPLRLQYLRVDPVKHLNSIKVLEDGRKAIEMRTDVNTAGCIAGGVELFRSAPFAQRPKQHSFAPGKLTVEKVYFAARYDDKCFNDFPNIRADLDTYRTLLSRYLKQHVLSQLNDDLLTGLPNWKALELEMIIQQKHNDNDQSETDIRLLEVMKRDATATLFQFLSKFFETTSTGSQDEESSGMHVLQSVEEDRLWGAATVVQRVFKPLINTLGENTDNVTHRCLAVNAHSADAIKRIVHMQTSNPLISPRWTLLNEAASAGHLDRGILSLLPCRLSYVDDTDIHDSTVDTLRNTFDLIYLDKVLCRQPDIGAYLTRLKEFAREHGFLFINEITADFDLAYFVHTADGKALPDSEDPSRKYGMYFNHAGWMKILKENGFRVVLYQTDPSLITTLYMVRAEYTTPKEPLVFDVRDVHEFSWLSPLQTAIQESQSQPDKKIWILSNSVKDSGAIGLAGCLRVENMSENRYRYLADISLRKENRDSDVIAFHLEDPFVQELIQDDIHSNCYRDGVWGRYIALSVNEDELQQFNERTAYAFMSTQAQGDLSSFAWFESSLCHYGALSAVKQKELGALIDVYYSALNFRDVMLATGRISGDGFADHPTRTYLCPGDKMYNLGIEFSGRLRATGERVMGICLGQAVATVAMTTVYVPVPDDMSMEEAATLPIVYGTVYYALMVRGRLRKGERVLIHGGAGAVGQAALNVALAFGCECFVTCGTEEKRRFLIEQYPQLDPVRHISNSRSSEFEYHVMKYTDGEGVDVVLNSLAGELLQASVRCLAMHGRFVEIGKYDITVNSSLGMAAFSRNISFHAIYLDMLLAMGKDGQPHADWPLVVSMLQEGIKNGVMKPLSRHVFERDQVEEAFRFMGAAKHIGKVLIKIRDEERRGSAYLPALLDRPPLRVTAASRAICHPEHVYVITGGLGGVGVELTHWLNKRGAKRIVLSTRSGVTTAYQRRWLNQCRRREDFQVHVSTQPINTEEGCRKLMEECLQMGPVGGIFHLAMVLRDAMIEEQKVENFKDAIAAKYYGTRHLDNVTREMCGDELRWFVVFSSMSARGNGGQTAYGWANAAMELIVEQRRQDGLPGVAIQWGAIGDVGVIMRHLGDNFTMVNGTYPQRIPSCLQMFDHFLCWQHQIVSSFVRADIYDGKKSSNTKAALMQSIARIVGVTDATMLDADSSLVDLGLDSLMGVEIKQVLERDFEIFLSPKDIRSLTLAKLAAMAESDQVRPHGNTDDAAPQQTTEADFEEDGIKQMQSAMQQQFPLRLDVNDVRNYDRLVAVNDVKQGRPVVFLHSMEGVATTGVRALCALLPFPVYCLQWQPDTNTDSMEAMADDYIQVLKGSLPTGAPYDIIGYSFGASLAMAMAARLQATHGVDGGVRRLVLIDGAPGHVQAYADFYRKVLGAEGFAGRMAESGLFEAELLCVFATRLDVVVPTAQLRRELQLKRSWDERAQHLVDVVARFGANVTFDDPSILRLVCGGIRKRFVCLENFTPEKFNGPIWLLRASQEERYIEVANDYGLNQIVNGQVTVHRVKGDHDSMVQGESSANTAALLTEIFSS